MHSKLILLFLFLNLAVLGQNRERAFQINAKLGHGVNFGNMFEAPSETDWGNPWQPEYPKMVAGLGFNHVRIPIRWEPADRSDPNPPYTVNSTFLNRIKQVVDSCLNNGLYAIINMHHHDALFADPDGQKARFLAQWKQISRFFRDYPDQLLFEILNEPNGNLTADKWNSFLADALDTIREDNPNRIVLIGTPDWGGLGGLSKLQLPADQNIIVTVHYYNPFQFTHQGAEWASGSDAWLGTRWDDTETERQVMRNEFALLKTFETEQHIPVHIGEFGSYSKADETSRKKWTTFLARYLDSLGWSWAYWEFSAGFGIYNTASHSYNQFLVDALLHNPMPQPAYYVGTPVYTSNFAQSVSGWNVYINGGAAATKESVSGQLAVVINTAGTQGWHVQLVRNGIKLEAGKKYRVSFIAKAAASRSITAYTGQSVDPWSAYSDYNSISLTTTLKEYSYLFDMKTTDNSARIVFDMGTSADDVFFESITLESVELQEPSSSAVIRNFQSKIFPNPVNDRLTIYNTDDFTQIKITNLQGISVLEQNLSDWTNEIDLRQQTSGIYFVSLTGQNQRFTYKIIKK